MGNIINRAVQSVTSVVERLCRLVKARFNIDLRYVALSDLATSEREHLHALLTQGGAPLDYQEKTLFPVYLTNSLVGFASIPRADAVDTDVRRELSDLIELFLDSTIGLRDQIYTLSKLEHEMLRTDQSMRNVIPLHRSVKEEAKFLVNSQPRAGFALPALITGICDEQINQLAQEIHYLSGRYAFVRDADMSWNKASDLKGLGPMTIFISDISSLDETRQASLVEYLNDQPGVDDPQIIIGSKIPYSALEASGMICPELLRQLSGCLLHMDRPMQEYRRQGILEFFFQRQPEGTSALELN